jgi:hypothetical protein
MNPVSFATKQMSNLRRRVGTLSLILVFALTLGAAVNAQAINFPVGVPVGTSGAGNARADADNFFIRNNVAGMTEIPPRDENGKQGLSAGGRFYDYGETISRSEPCRIGGSGSADFILCAYAIQIEHQSALQGFDLELRIITRRNGRLCAQSREFTHSGALHLATFNKLTVEPRGTMLAVIFE